MDRSNYIYMVHRHDGTPLYIGKGTGERYKRHDSRAKANPHYAAVLAQAGGSLPVTIVADDLSEKEAYNLERLFTKEIGIESEGGPLINCGHGGRGGPVGVKHSEKWKAARSRIAAELWQDEQYRAKMLRPDRPRGGNASARSAEFKAAVSAKLKGNSHTLGFHHSDEAKAKMSAKRKGVPKSAETRTKMKESAKRAKLKREGFRHSEETKALIAAKIKGRRLSDETKALLSAKKKGIAKSAEARANMKKAQEIAGLKRKGFRHSEESIALMRAKATGKHPSDETRAKISASKKGAPGHPHSEEAKARMSEAQKKAWLKRKYFQVSS